MIPFLLKMLGVSPGSASDKTGAREAAWTLIGIALGLTIGSMWRGPETVREMVPVLIVIWPSAILAVCGAYKLQFDRKVLRGRNQQQGYDAAGYSMGSGYSAPMPPPPSRPEE